MLVLIRSIMDFCYVCVLSGEKFELVYELLSSFGAIRRYGFSI